VRGIPISADYINYGKISIQIKDKFRLEMRRSTNEGKTTAGMRSGVWYHRRAAPKIAQELQLTTV
jgi:hypothetical protein